MVDRLIHPSQQTPQAALTTVSATWDNGGSGYGTLTANTAYVLVSPTVDTHIVVSSSTDDPAQVGVVYPGGQLALIECDAFTTRGAAYLHTKGLSDGTTYWTTAHN